MKRNDLNSATIFVGMGAGEITCTDENGVILFSEGLNPGRYHGRDWVPFVGEGDVTLAGSVTVMQRQDGHVRPVPMDRVEVQSGANPDFRPTRATDAELRMRELLKEVNRKTNGLDQRIATLQRIQNAQGVIGVDETPVIEPPEVEAPEDENQSDEIPVKE